LLLKIEEEKKMYISDTTVAAEKIRKCKIPLPRKTTNRDFDKLLPLCNCDCKKLQDILQSVKPLYDYFTSDKFKIGLPSPISIYVVSINHFYPNEVLALNEAAGKFGCRIKFVIYYPEMGIMRIEPLE
jgi:hypothetical protein